MNKFFTKHLNLKLQNYDLEALKGSKMEDYLSIRYFEPSDPNFIASLPKVCKIPPALIRITEASDVRGDGFIMPHIDHYLSCALNYYIEPAGCTTVFYDKKPDAKPIPFPGKTTSNLYRPGDLIEREAFTAEPHSCYLLNVSEIHGIIVPSPTKIRRFIQWQWLEEPFEEILANLL